MWKKISEVPRKAIAGAMEFVKGLKNDERGLSGVVVAILLILVAVLAIVLIWGFLSGWLQELWEQITSGASAIR
jgi:Flp pilus assembly pilin Flp